VRPADPHPEKLEIYECGEPTIGSSFVQFDLRFYVVALLFIIFDVEVALFFPWATVFGKSVNLMDERFAAASADGLTDDATKLYQELGVRKPSAPTVVPLTLRDGYENRYGEGSALQPVQGQAASQYIIRNSSRELVWITIVDISVFFAVLMIGFAYVWRRGDLDWVRAISRDRLERSDLAPPEASVPEESVPDEEPALSA
jgi:NADH-quinone oxidoreductase subunit A